jgi:tetratricopeptide (TPR) repeat protein
VTTRLAAAERSLNAGNLNDARRAYRELLGAPGLDHEAVIRVAEGLYRARDFSAALSAFNRAGTLRRGEEPYRFYIAVAFYETGDFARAKKELAAARPFIEITPDVARYKTKIEGSM